MCLIDFGVKRSVVYPPEAGEEMEPWLSVEMDSSQINLHTTVTITKYCTVHGTPCISNTDQIQQ